MRGCFYAPDAPIQYSHSAARGVRALCAFTLAICLVLVVDARLRPAVRNIAMTRAKSLAVRTVGESIEKFISENPEECSALVSVGSNDGKIGSMSLNAASVNLFSPALSAPSMKRSKKMQNLL